MKRKIYRAAFNFMMGGAELALSLLRILDGFHFRSAPLKRIGSKALVLGNGPSLKADLDEIARLAASGSVDLWCVNFFANSPAYLRLKPANYVIADPGHWQEDVTEELRLDLEHFLKRITQVTDWDVLLHFPYSALGTDFVARLTANKYIKVRFFNETAVACRIKAVLFWLYRHELAMPACQNVLVPALYLAILSGYEKVGIVGADHSWHRDVVVRDSVVMLRDPHFYDNDARLKPFYKNATETFSMAEIFRIWAKVFAQYDLLSGFARTMRVSVVNGSSVSFIDSFRSDKLSQF